jgi:molecular chaperone DnaK (HSP70)
MGKIYKIVMSHGLTPLGYVITVPSYMSHYERKIVKRCGEIVLHSPEVMLIDDWLSIASEYSYNKITEIKAMEPRIVIFIDIGYSKCSFFVIEFGRK